MRNRPPTIFRRVTLSLVSLALVLGPAAAGHAAPAPPPSGDAEAALSAAIVADSGDLQDFDIESMDVDYTLTRADDGTSRALVVETIVAVFPDRDQNRGLQRRIPTTYQGVPIFPSLTSVTDGEGADREHDTDTDDGALVITAAGDDFVRGEQTYVLTYELQNVVTNFRDTDADEFYWDVNGVDWAQPFGSVTARVNLDEAVADALTGEAACYRGAQGATEQCQISDAAGEGPGAGAAIEASTGALAPFETMTIAVGFETGTFTKFDTSFSASPWGWAQAVAAALGLGAVGLAATVRSRRLRDEPGRPTIIAEYTPPADLDALESAMLLGHTSKAIPAEVLEQAIVGSIRIVEVPGRGMFGSAKLQAHLVDASLADGDGRMLLEGLFGEAALAENRGDAVYEFGSTDTRFSKAAQKILAAATADLKARGMRREVPATVIGWTIVVAVVATIAAVGFGVAALLNGVAGPLPLTLILVSIAAALTACVLVSRNPLTARGAEARDHLAGLKVFIEWAEADRIRMLQSPAGAERTPIDTQDTGQMLVLYERLLPYAVVFGQEKQWSERLAVLYGDGVTPAWYSGTSSFNAAAFSTGISTLSTSAASSTSGGSTGGGSAGGGGGGGGGGGV